MLSAHLVGQVQHTHVCILHLENAIFQQELAAQVIQVGCSHWVHSLVGKKPAVMGVACLLMVHWASPACPPPGPTCFEGTEVLQRLFLIEEGVQSPHQQDDGQEAP